MQLSKFNTVTTSYNHISRQQSSRLKVKYSKMFARCEMTCVCRTSKGNMFKTPITNPHDMEVMSPFFLKLRDRKPQPLLSH